MKKKIYILVTLLSLAFCLFGINPACAANADVSGFWQINLSAPDMTVYTEQIDAYFDGHQERFNFTDTEQVFPVLLLPQITQSADGTISGYSEVHTPYSTVTQTIAGSVAGNAINFRLTFNSITSQSGVCDVTMTYTYDFSGTVLGNAMSGSFSVYKSVSGTYYNTSYTSYVTSYGETSGTFTAQRAGIVLDTVITSGPEGTINNRDVSFTWMGVGGEGGIVGYYYQLDSQPQVFITQTSITFNNLDYGPHTFSVAAKDGKGNVDSTPAVRNFTIEEPQPPTTPPDTDFGNPKDSQKSVGDPINSVTGNMHIITQDLFMPGRGFNFEFIRAYNSQEVLSSPLGYGWTHSYNVFLTEDKPNKLVKIKDEQAKGYIFVDNLNGTYVVPPGEYSTLVKNTTGFIWKKKDGKQYIFNLSGKLTQIKDRKGNAINFTYDVQGRLSKITDTVGRSINFAYDASNRLTQLTDPAGRRFYYTYDSQDNLVGVADPQGNYTSYEYDNAHNLTRKTNARGDAFYFSYDSSDRCISSRQENNQNRVDLVFDPANKQTTVTDSQGNRTTQYYNDDAQIIEVINPLNGITLSSWDRNFNLISRTDELGRTTSLQYDAKGNLTKITNTLGNVTTFTYEPNFNLLKTSTDALGNVTTYTYDTKGNLTKITDALRNTTSNKYSVYGQIISSANQLGKKTYFGYDAQGNLSLTRDPMRNITYFTYDAVGNLTQVTDAKKNITRFFYDELNQLIQIIYPDNSTVSYAYDAVGNRIAVTDANSNTAYYNFDQAHHIKSVTDALGYTVNYDYDSEGNLIQVRDQNNDVTTYEYDSLNRLIQQTDALGHSAQYQYDATGNRTRQIDTKGQTINYEYDNLNRLKKIIYPTSAVEYSYDILGRRISMTDTQGTTTYAYDKLSRLLKVDGPFANDIIQYTCDKAGNRLTMTDPDGKITKYAYDASGRLTSITDPQRKKTTYTYDALNNLTSVVYPNKTKAVYAYDNLSRLLKLTNQKSAKPYNKFSEFSYTYDSAGRKTAVNLLDGGITYSYNARGELIQENRTSASANYQISYDYDPSGNRMQMINNSVAHTYSYNALNQLVNEQIAGSGQITYAYDNNGNLIREQGPTKTTNFTYDIENRLTQIAAPGINLTYAYDGESRRIASQNSSSTTNYLYDGLNVILERNASGATTASYIRNPSAPGGIGGIIKGLSPKGTDPGESYYHYDGLGSVVNLTNPTGASIQSYAYDAFGNVLSQTGSGNNRNKFLTKESDASGLIYFGARYYDPRIGRFITRDPIESVNSYFYCYNNPTNLSDPYGLWVAIGQRQIFGPGNHTVIILHPDNPSQFISDPRFYRNSKGALEATLGANPDWKPNINSPFGNLTAYPNAPRDRPDNLYNIQRISDPLQRSDSQLVRDILNSASKYKNNLPYDPTPWLFDPYYNSNSYTSGILKDAGISNPPILPWWQPGADKPIPLTKNKK